MFSISIISSLFTLLTIINCVTPNNEELTLTILHTNDVHSRFRQTNKYSGPCSEEEEQNNQCFGGFARLHGKVKEIRSTHSNVVYLSGGDYYQGTVWFTLNKWKIVSHFVNILNHTAMALGNHEFDDGIPGLVPFLESATFPIISSNIDATNEPTMQGKFSRSLVLEFEGRKVGIIGYTTVETMDISNPGSLIFNDVVQSIKKETERLHDEGVNILIAVGHAGFDVDMKIAKEVPLIDVVVGGHTNTFLYNGQPPSTEYPIGPYPTVIEQPGNGRRVPVVQAYAFGKYLGYLNATFDSKGELIRFGGNPIILDYSVPQDPDVLRDIEEWGKNVSSEVKEVVGHTRVFLNGSAAECRLRECSLGNVVTDAMVHMNLKFSINTTDYWSDVTMAIMNGGGVRGSIDERSRAGSITFEDILTVLPFSNTIDLIEVKGKTLRAAFEFSVQDYDPKGYHLAGKFLQASGIKVLYDISQPNGKRVRRIKVRCKACRVPTYVPLEDEEVYKVALPSYVADGGDGFTVLKEGTVNRVLQGILDSDMLVEYIKSRKTIIQGVGEGRVRFLEDESQCGAGDFSGRSAASALIGKEISVLLLFSYVLVYFPNVQ